MLTIHIFIQKTCPFLQWLIFTKFLHLSLLMLTICYYPVGFSTVSFFLPAEWATSAARREDQFRGFRFSPVFERPQTGDNNERLLLQPPQTLPAKTSFCLHKQISVSRIHQPRLPKEYFRKWEERVISLRWAIKSRLSKSEPIPCLVSKHQPIPCTFPFHRPITCFLSSYRPIAEHWLQHSQFKRAGQFYPSHRFPRKEWQPPAPSPRLSTLLFHQRTTTAQCTTFQHHSTHRPEPVYHPTPEPAHHSTPEPAHHSTSQPVHHPTPVHLTPKP